LNYVNSLNQLSGPGNWTWSTSYPFVAPSSGSWSPQAFDTWEPFETTISLDPWVSNLRNNIQLVVSLPGQQPRTIVFQLPFRVGASIMQPESQTGTNKPLIFNWYGPFQHKPFFVAGFAMPELVVTARAFVRAHEPETRFTPARVRDVPIFNYVGCRSCPTPSFYGRLRVPVIPPDYTWDARYFGFPYYLGVHEIVVIVNEGLPSQETVSDWFALLEIEDAREVLGIIKNGGSYSDHCSSTVDISVVCFETGANIRESAYFPGYYYPVSQSVKMGMRVNAPLPVALPDAVASAAPARMALLYANELWMRGDLIYFGRAYGEVAVPVIPPSRGRVSIGFDLSITVEQEIWGVAPGQTPQARSIRITTSGLIVASFQYPIYRVPIDVPVVSVKIDVFFSFGIGPTQVFCNQYARYQQSCDVDGVANKPGWTVSPGYSMEIRARAQATAGIPILISISIWSEMVFRSGSLRVRNSAGNIQHDSGVSVNFRVCGSASFLFVSYTWCPVDFTTSSGTLPNLLNWKRAAITNVVGRWQIDTRQYSQQFQQLQAAQTWEAKRKRAIPLADEGIIMQDTMPDSKPVVAAGVGSSNGLAMLAWTMQASAAPNPRSHCAYSIYNSTTDKLSDPLVVRSGPDSDSASSVVALPDGRFLLLFNSIPDHATTAGDFSFAAKAEIISAVYDPISSSWNRTLNVTFDGQYFDGMVSAIPFTNPQSGAPYVLAAWVRDPQFPSPSGPHEILTSVFDPVGYTWTSPSVLLGSVVLKSPPSLAVANGTILLAFVNAVSLNESIALLHKFDLMTMSWAAAPVPVGRNYQLLDPSSFNQSTWEVSNPLQYDQESVVVTSKGSNFVVVWTDANAIFSRTYSRAILDSLFAAPTIPQPPVQLVWMRAGAAPRALAVNPVASGTQVGMILSWQSLMNGANSWNLDFMRQPSLQWESAPIDVEHDPHSNVLQSALFSASGDTAFAILSSQEVLRYANQTEYLGDSSIQYKRINLLPILVLEDATVSVPESPVSVSPYNVRVVIRNKGLLPSLPFSITLAQGDLFGPFPTAPNTTLSVSPLGPSSDTTVFFTQVSAIPFENGGYLWVSVANSSVHPMRIPVFAATVTSVSVLPSNLTNTVVIQAVIKCKALALSAASRDPSAAVRLQVYTRASSDDVRLGSLSVACPLDESAVPVSYLVNPSVLQQQVTVAVAPLDDFTPASFFSANNTVGVNFAPDLRLYGPDQVTLLDSFVGRLRYSVKVFNGGLAPSRNVTVNVTVSSPSVSSLVAASAFVPEISPLSSVTVDLPIGTQFVNSAGLYNFTISAFSGPSLAAVEQRNAEIAANMTTTPSQDYEADLVDNTKFVTNVRVYSAWKPRFGAADVYIKASPMTLKLWIANAAVDVSPAAVPVRFYVIADNLPLTLLGEAEISSLAPSSASVLNIIPAANAGGLASSFGALSNARVFVSIPPLFSGSQSPAELEMPLSVALTNDVPSLAKSFLGEPGLLVPAIIAMGPNETLQYPVQFINFFPQTYGALSVIQTQGSEAGIRFNNVSRFLTFDSSTIQDLPATFISTLSLTFPGGTVFESYTTQITVSSVSAPPIPLPPLQAPVDVAPSDPAPVDPSPVTPQPPAAEIVTSPNSSSQNGGGAAAGIAIGIILAILVALFIILAVLFARRKHRGDQTSDSVKLFFTPWKKDSESSSKSVPLAPIPVVAADETESSSLTSDSTVSSEASNSSDASSASPSAKSSASSSDASAAESAETSESHESSEQSNSPSDHSDEQSESASESPESSEQSDRSASNASGTNEDRLEGSLSHSSS
jgi:hypothetical protein